MFYKLHKFALLKFDTNFFLIASFYKNISIQRIKMKVFGAPVIYLFNNLKVVLIIIIRVWPSLNEKNKTKSAQTQYWWRTPTTIPPTNQSIITDITKYSYTDNGLTDGLGWLTDWPLQIVVNKKWAVTKRKITEKNVY